MSVSDYELVKDWLRRADESCEVLRRDGCTEQDRAVAFAVSAAYRRAATELKCGFLYPDSAFTDRETPFMLLAVL